MNTNREKQIYQVLFTSFFASFTYYILAIVCLLLAILEWNLKETFYAVILLIVALVLFFFMFFFFRRSFQKLHLQPKTNLQKAIFIRFFTFTTLILLIFGSSFLLSLSMNQRLILSIALLCAGILFLRNLVTDYLSAKLQDSIILKNANQQTADPFYLVVKNFRKLTELNTYQISGFINGKIKQYDTIYIYMNERQYYVGKTLTLHKGLQEVTEIENEQVLLTIFVETIPSNQDTLWVLSNMTDYEYVSIDSMIRNPYLTGLISAPNEIRKQNKYLHSLCNSLVHAHFYIPTQLPKQLGSNIPALFLTREPTFFAVASLSREGDPNEYVPVFTSLDSLHRSPVNSFESYKVLVMNFPELTQLVTRFSGNLVINPFGPGVFFLPRTAIDEIQDSPSYMDLFHLWKGDTVEEKITNYYRSYLKEPFTLQTYFGLFMNMCEAIPVETLFERRKVKIFTEAYGQKYLLLFQFIRSFHDDELNKKSYILELQFPYDSEIKPMEITETFQSNLTKRMNENTYYKQLSQSIPDRCNYYSDINA